MVIIVHLTVLQREYISRLLFIDAFENQQQENVQNAVRTPQASAVQTRHCAPDSFAAAERGPHLLEN